MLNIVIVYVVDFSIFIAVKKKSNCETVKLSSCVETTKQNRFDLRKKLSIEVIKKQQANKQAYAVCSFKSLSLQ